MAVLAGPQRDLPVGDGDDVAHAVLRQFEPGAGGSAGGGVEHPRHTAEPPGQVVGVHVRRQINRGERAERPVMNHIGVGDRQDHPGPRRAEPVIQQLLQVNHPRPAGLVMFRVHAVIGGQRDGAAECVELGPVAVHHGVEGVRIVGARRVLVLNIVGCREIGDVRAPTLHQGNTSGEYELAEIGAVDRGQRPAGHPEHVLDAIVIEGRLIRLFRRKTDSPQFVAEQPAQLVLGGDHGDPGAGVGEGGENGAAAQHRRIVHHHLGVGLPIVEIVSGDTVNSGWHPGDDRQVVRIGEARHDAVGDSVDAAGARPGEPGHRPGGDRGIHVVGLGAIDADHHQGRSRPCIAASVHGDFRFAGHF